MPDLPPVSQDFNDPLPTVDPNSDLVPYRTSSTAPGQAPVVTTGYAARARPPIQPPEGFGGGVGMPNLDQIYQAAFSKLPVDEAVKAVDAATRYIGQRGYQRDLASGMNAAQAFAKWGPTLFKQATGIPESIERSVAPPISPQQMIQNRMAQQRIDMAAAAAKARAEAATRMTPYQQAELELRRRAADLAEKKASTEKPEETVTEETKIPAVEGKEAEPASSGFLGIGAHPATEAVPAQPARTIRTTRKVDSNPAKTDEVVRVTKDGRKAVFDANTKKFIRYAE